MAYQEYPNRCEKNVDQSAQTLGRMVNTIKLRVTKQSKIGLKSFLGGETRSKGGKRADTDLNNTLHWAGKKSGRTAFRGGRGSNHPSSQTAKGMGVIHSLKEQPANIASKLKKWAHALNLASNAGRVYPS